MKAFLLSFLVRPGEGRVRGAGRVLLADSFHRFSGEHHEELHEISVGLPSISAGGNWMEKLLFCAVSIYLLFVYLLFVYLFAFQLFLRG